MPIGPTTIGRLTALPVAQRASALGCSSADSAESDPAKSIVPVMNCWRPLLEPIDW